jgi:hypothetical protein
METEDSMVKNIGQIKAIQFPSTKLSFVRDSITDEAFKIYITEDDADVRFPVIN